MKKTIKRVVREPSSWAGLGGIFQAAAAVFPAHAAALNLATVVAGALAVAMRESTAQTNPAGEQ